MVRREAVKSVLIEEGDVDIEEMFRPGQIERERTTEKDAREAINYETVIRDGSKAVSETGDITIEHLHRLHRTLLEGAVTRRNTSGSSATV